MFLLSSVTMLGVDFREQVGEWIAIRRDELGMGPADLAMRVGVTRRSVDNAEAGRTEVKQGRTRWEDALGWEHGSLLAAYKRGERPKVAGRPAMETPEEFVARVVPPEHRESVLGVIRLATRQEDRPTRGDRKIG